jgi:hypothetical protein
MRVKGKVSGGGGSVRESRNVEIGLDGFERYGTEEVVVGSRLSEKDGAGAESGSRGVGAEAWLEGCARQTGLRSWSAVGRRG